MREKLKKLWPLWLCVAISLSCNLMNKKSARDGDPEDAGSSSRSSNDGESSLTDSAWKGTVNCDNGENLDSTYRVAASGNPIYQYQTRNGPREVELIEPGQQIRFVPPGGGVTSIVVDSIEVAPGNISYSMSISEEKAGGETLSQSQATMQTVARVAGQELDLQITIRSRNVLSQPGIVVPGDESAVICSGKLQK